MNQTEIFIRRPPFDDVPSFVEWLRRYTFRYPPPVFEEEPNEWGDGSLIYVNTCFSKAKPIEGGNRKTGEIFVAIEKYRIESTSRNDQALKFMIEERDLDPIRFDRIEPEQIAILFAIAPLYSGRIEVHARCLDVRVMDYLENLIKEIDQLPAPVLAGDDNEPELPPHPLKERRATVLEMVKSGKHFEVEIAKAINESVDVVKQDKRWLKARGFLSKKK